MLKKTVSFLLLNLFLLFSVFPSAFGETLGFGYVNAKDVAVRRGIGGKVIGRLPLDTCVWIRNTKKDNKGVLWYEINAGVNQNHTNLDYTGWMKAEFIDAGETLWHDVESVKAAGNGIIVLRKDGTAQSAGGWIISKDHTQRVSLRHWTDGLQDIRQVGVCDIGMVNYATGRDGTWYTTEARGEIDSKKIRLASSGYILFAMTTDFELIKPQGDFNWIWPHTVDTEQLSHVTAIDDSSCRIVFLTDEGKLLVAQHMEDESGAPEPDWENWTELVSVEASAASFTGAGGRYSPVYAGIRRDGTVLAAPEMMENLIGNWRDMRKIVVAGSWVMGLKQDGTILTAGNVRIPEVSGWTGITDIAAGNDYCVGLKEDGTLVFAGNHVFMGEGHNRK